VSRRSHGAAVVAGVAAGFAAAVFLATAIRPALLVDPDPHWAAARLLLGLAVLAGAGTAGVAAAAVFSLWARTRPAKEPLASLPIPTAALAALALAVLALGALARFAQLESLPAPLWVDDLSLIEPALALGGKLSDFGDPVRPSPYGTPTPYGTVGVLYLELYRAALLFFGTTVFGVRFLSAAAGVLSIATAMALGRELLPRGGGVPTGLAVAGMRWHLILSRWGWNAFVLVPVLDGAALLLLAGRRRRSLALVVAAGLLAGIGAHIYLAAWIGLAALTVFLLWPVWSSPGRWRLLSAGVFLSGFLVAASPLFLIKGRTPYFRRAGEHNVVLEMRRQRSAVPLVASAAGALAAPWFLSDPSPWNDLPGRSRLGWIVGLAVAAGLARALLRPREELSSFLLAHGTAAFAATVAWGTEMQPNGYRVAYLTTVTGVAAAAGALSLLSLFPTRLRRAAGIAAVGLFLISGALAARDLYLRWGPMLEVSEGYQGRDNLLARAAQRWQRYGWVSVDPGLSSVLANGIPVYLDALVRYQLAGGGSRPSGPGAEAGTQSKRRFRLALVGTLPSASERLVERVRDGNGKEWALVFGGRDSQETVPRRRPHTAPRGPKTGPRDSPTVRK